MNTQYAWQQVIILAEESRTFIVNRQALQVIMVWPYLSSRYAAKIILQGTEDGSRRRARLRKSWSDNIKEWTGHSLSSLMRIADDRSRWVTIAVVASVGVPQRRLGGTRVS